MGDREKPSLRARELGAALRDLATRTGYTGHQLARLMGVSESMVSRMFTGTGGMNETNLALVLTLCRAHHHPDRDHWTTLLNERHRLGWIQPHPHGPWAYPPTLTLAENHASTLTHYHPTHIPLPAQVPDHTRALLATSLLPPTDPKTHLDAHNRRCALPQRDPRPQVRFLIEEHALLTTHPHLDPATRMAQLDHLNALAKQDNITIQVIPEHTLPEHRREAFQLITTPGHRPIVVLPHLAGLVFLEDHSSYDIYRTLATTLSTAAYNTEDTHTLLSTLADHALHEFMSSQ